MTRVPLEDTGWFDSDYAIKFEEATYWNGNNHISIATGSQWDHEAIYYTKSGNWVINEWSNMQGSKDTYRKINEIDAINWLIKNERTNNINMLPEKVQKVVTEKINEQEV